MPAAYRGADLVWYPTIDEEPFGLVPLEAMAVGTPLVVLDSGGMRETVTDGQNGLVVPKGDATRLCEAAASLLRDETLRRRLVAAGRRRSRDFDLERFAGQLEKVYRAAEAA
jgi:glycosyltransferase involved in cell wall biosynthesis